MTVYALVLTLVVAGAFLLCGTIIIKKEHKETFNGDELMNKIENFKL